MTLARLGLMALTWFAMLAAAPSAWAQATDNDLGSSSFGFAALFPQLRTAPAPAFLQPGVRVTYATGSATGNGGPAGGGIVQYDVVTRDAGQGLAYLQGYGNDGGGYYPLYAGYVRGYPGLGDFWIQPSVLVNAEALSSANLTVTRYQKTLASGQTLTVVRFQTQTVNGRTITEWDAATGVMVFDSIAAGASAGQVVLVGIRQVTMPWGPGRAPNWVRPGAQLDFAGVQQTAIPGAGVAEQPVAARVSVAQAGARWSLFAVQASIGGQDQGTQPAVTGQLQPVGAYWLPETARNVPLTAAGLRLDADPATGAELYFGAGDDGDLVLQLLTPVSRTTWSYDRTLGVLDRVLQERTEAVTSTTLDLVRTTSNQALQALAAQPPLPEDPGAAGGAGGGGDSCAGAGPPGPGPLLLILTAFALQVARRRLRPRVGAEVSARGTS